jgi:hypothetical protein
MVLAKEEYRIQSCQKVTGPADIRLKVIGSNGTRV